jgi:cyclophilin family peptidyl-prolyl cis-trans isomerase
VPTDKRERQRAGREARRAEARAAQMRAARRRQIITDAIAAAVILGIGLAINLGGKNDSKNAVAAGKTKPKDTVACPAADGSSTKRASFPAAPPNCISATSDNTAEVVTDDGTFLIGLDAKAAPKTVNNFVYLSRYHAYDGVPFHRVIPGFVVQGGDVALKDGAGGPGYEFADELPTAGSYKIGSVAMANSGPNTNGSQFFVITGDQGVALPPNYSLFGTVIDGIDVVKKIEADGTESGTPTVRHIIQTVTITEKKG